MGVEDNYFILYISSLQGRFLHRPADAFPSRAAKWRTTPSDATQAPTGERSSVRGGCAPPGFRSGAVALSCGRSSNKESGVRSDVLGLPEPPQPGRLASPPAPGRGPADQG